MNKCYPEDRLQVIDITSMGYEKRKMLALKFPTGHIAMSGGLGTGGAVLVSFIEMENYHRPCEKIIKTPDEHMEPKFGVIFENLDSIRAIGNNLLKIAQHFSGGKENEEIGNQQEHIHVDAYQRTNE